MVSAFYKFELAAASRESVSTTDGHQPDPLEPVGSAVSSQSIHAKQTGATLAETFSSLSASEGRDPDEERTGEIDIYHREGDLKDIDKVGGSYSCPRISSAGTPTFNLVTQSDKTPPNSSDSILAGDVCISSSATSHSRHYPKDLRISRSDMRSDVQQIAAKATAAEESALSQASSPLQSFFSSESGSSWEGSACSASRDLSLLDSADSQDYGYSYEDEEVGVPGTLAEVLQNIKACNLEATSSSFDDETLPHFEFLPPVDASKLDFGVKCQNQKNCPRMQRRDGNVVALFSRMSALSKEWMSGKEDGGSLRWKSLEARTPKRRDDMDPTKKIMESLVCPYNANLNVQYPDTNDSAALTFFLFTLEERCF